MNDRPTVEMIPMPVYDFDATHEVGDIVVLHADCATKATAKTIYRVDATPNPTAKRKAERECYSCSPISGGRGLAAEGWMLVAASDAQKAKAATTPKVDRMPVGTLVTSSARLSGAPNGVATVLVVISEAANGTVKLVVANGTGTYWTGVPVTTLTRADVVL